MSQKQIDDYNTFLINKKRQEFFKGVNNKKDKQKKELGVSYKGKLIEMDEHCRGIINEENN